MSNVHMCRLLTLCIYNWERPGNTKHSNPDAVREYQVLGTQTKDPFKGLLSASF